MTVNTSIDHARLLAEHLAQASPDLLRELLQTFINTLHSAEADAVCGAEYGAITPERVNRRNGYRRRDFDTRAGTLDVAIPKLRRRIREAARSRLTTEGETDATTADPTSEDPAQTKGAYLFH
jgi:transposase-like protein